MINMENENVKVKITMNIPFNKPNRNGTIFTEDAVENAVNNIPLNIPIIYGDNKNEYPDIAIGHTTGNSHIVVWDFENQVCKITLDGIIFCSNARIIVDKNEDGKISEFRIVGIDLM